VQLFCLSELSTVLTLRHWSTWIVYRRAQKEKEKKKTANQHPKTKRRTLALVREVVEPPMPERDGEGTQHDGRARQRKRSKRRKRRKQETKKKEGNKERKTDLSF
jgi:hypothetical protein